MKVIKERLKKEYSPAELHKKVEVSKWLGLASSVMSFWEPQQNFFSFLAFLGSMIYHKRFFKLFEKTQIGRKDVIFTMGKDEFGRPVGIDKFHFHRHMLVVGGTGMGKTSLYRVIIRQLLKRKWGIIYINFKAEDEDFFNLYFLCKEAGLEKDLLVLNFAPSASKTLETHTYSPMATLKTPQEIADFFFYLLAPAKGEQEYWQGRGRFLMQASARVFCYLRDIKKKKPNLELFLDSFELSEILAAYRDKACPEKYKKYFQMYLQDLDPSGSIRKGGNLRQIPSELQSQHGYALQQWKETFSDIIFRYSHIFDTSTPDIDMLEVLKMNKILYIHMPALQMPDKTKETIGRLILASLRTATGTLLGERLLGKYEELTEIKKKEKPLKPFLIIIDEHGTAPIVGIDDYMRQIRSLGGGIIIADQNWDTLKEKYGEGYLYSILANSHTKVIMKVEGSKTVFDYLKERIPRVRKVLPDYRKRDFIEEEAERRTLQEDYLFRPEKVMELGVGEGIVIQGENFLKTKFDFYVPEKEGEVELFSYRRDMVKYPSIIQEKLKELETLKGLKTEFKNLRNFVCVTVESKWEEEKEEEEQQTTQTQFVPQEERIASGISEDELEEEEGTGEEDNELQVLLSEIEKLKKMKAISSIKNILRACYLSLSEEEKEKVAEVLFNEKDPELLKTFMN